VRKIDTHRFVRATRATPRDINRRILLNLVRDHQPISRADLARRMGLGRGMVTSLVDELLAEGAVYEGGTADAPRGRRPQMLYVRTRDRLVVAADVRFSRTALMLADFDGRPLAHDAFDTVADPAGLVAAVAGRVGRLLAAHAAGGRCEGIGLVVPGMVDQRTGRVLNAPQLGWRDVDVRAPLADATGLPVQVENAPVACAQAQLWLGQRGGAEGPRDFAYLTVSDGVGVGVVVDGQVVRGHGSTAGEFGHVPLSLDGPRCLCGARGCLEAYTSNLATVSRYLGRELAAPGTRALLQASGLTVGDVVARAGAGDARAAAALDETARYLGAGIAAVVNVLNPARLFVGGEITAAWDRVAPAVGAALAERALTAAAAATPIVAEPPEALPRLRGAAALVAAPAFAAPQLA
jgi:predicted NBD/HSP70 family sugar kinase